MTLLTTLLSGAGGGGGGSGSVSGVILVPVVAASVGALTVTYANGSSGVGATLTNAGAQAAIQLDGISPTVGQRVLIKNQAAPAQNGVYTVTTVGTGATNWVLTRATDLDQASEMTAGSLVEAIGGTVNASTVWTLTAAVVTVGTTSVTFSSINITTKVDQNGSPIYGADSVGTDAYAITLAPAPSAYTAGMVINFTAGTANTGAATLNVNALGAKTIVKRFNQTLADGDIASGQVVSVVYDGTNFQMQSQTANSVITTGQLKSFQVLTSGTAATYTRPAGVTQILVEAIGGGGNGGTAIATAVTLSAGGGGGAGGYCRKFYSSAASSYTYTVGGAAANTTFDTMTANGGTSAASVTGWAAGQIGASGAAGSASGGDFNEPGQPGANGFSAAGIGSSAGNGGSSYFGGGAKGGSVPNGAGVNAVANSGAGGSGAVNNSGDTTHNGGNGGSGLIVVWEFS